MEWTGDIRCLALIELSCRIFIRLEFDKYIFINCVRFVEFNCEILIAVASMVTKSMFLLMLAVMIFASRAGMNDCRRDPVAPAAACMAERALPRRRFQMKQGGQFPYRACSFHCMSNYPMAGNELNYLDN
ncbi:hypothetical protein [Janthinobacterium sp. P210006]|uniref:hypothetical protein n=1 Tax=Janthinobacterium sp. P210006 TaxID=3112939 RepID=UPI002E26E34A|nr:hypothetical protein [Janthinobacterium sp. P210006]